MNLHSTRARVLLGVIVLLLVVIFNYARIASTVGLDFDSRSVTAITTSTPTPDTTHVPTSSSNIDTHIDNKVKQEPKKKGYHVVLGGVAKGISAAQIRHQIPRLIKLGEQFDSYHIVIYENDSPGDTRNTYIEELNKTKHSTYMFEDNSPHNVGRRTDKLAYARNRVLQYVQANLSQAFDYMMITDMDQTCAPFHNEGNLAGKNQWDADFFKYALSRSSEWDMLTFLHLPYWDLWAFRDRYHIPFNHHHPPHNEKNPSRSVEELDKYLKLLPPLELVEVESGFMLWAIYKIPYTFNTNYTGVGIFGEEDCEHVGFHRQMKEKNGARIRLLPHTYCIGDPYYKSLKELNVTLPTQP